MWWEFHRLMDLTPEQLVDEDDPIGLLEPVGPLDEAKKGKQIWRYRFPDQEFDLGRRRPVYDPAKKQARPGRAARSTGPSATLVASIRRRGPSTSSASVDEPHPRRRSCRSPWVRTPEHQASPVRARRVGRRARDRRPTGRIGRRATCCCGRPPRVGQARRRAAPPRRARPISRPRDGSRLALDATSSPIQGPPGSGKTYTGARMIVHAARGRASGSGSPARATRSSATCSRRSSRPPTSEGVDVRAGPARRRRTRSSTTRGSSAAKDAGRRPRRASTTAGRTSPPGRPGCGRRRRWPTPSTSCSSTRPARSRSPTSSRWRGAADSLVLLGDPQQLDQPLQGIAPAGRRPVGAGPRPRRRRDDAAGPRAVPRDDLAPPPGPVPRSRPRSSTTTGSSPSRTSSSSGSTRAGRALDGVGPRLARGRDGRRRQRIAGRGRGGRRASPRRSSSGGATLGRRSDGVGRPRRLGRRPHRRAVQRPGRRDRAAACRPRPGSARSTSSRARRRRSASTR